MHMCMPMCVCVCVCVSVCVCACVWACACTTPSYWSPLPAMDVGVFAQLSVMCKLASKGYLIQANSSCVLELFKLIQAVCLSFSKMTCGKIMLLTIFRVDLKKKKKKKEKKKEISKGLIVWCLCDVFVDEIQMDTHNQVAYKLLICHLP